MSMLQVTPTEVLGQPALSLRSPDGAEATVLPYGGHVVSFRPAGGEELLYLSPTARAGSGQAVRGGVPVIFPQFDRRGPEPGVPRHGFARTRRFTHAGTDARGLRLTLCDDDETRASFPHGFLLTVRVALGARSLTLGLEIESRAQQPFGVTCALHTYLRVHDVAHVFIEGLSGKTYEDQIDDGKERTEAADALRVEGEVDRVYDDVRELTLYDGARRVHVTQRGFEDAVVWNPGPARAAALPDLPGDGYRSMLCLEAARVRRPVQLHPGARFEGSQTLTLA